MGTVTTPRKATPRAPLNPYTAIWVEGSGTVMVTVWALDHTAALSYAAYLMGRSVGKVWTVIAVTDGKPRGW